MAEEFSVNAYWLERGRGYIDERRTPPEFHRLQERFLLDILRRGGFPMQRVLEVGCGYGRITKLLAEAWPKAGITALDLSPEQLTHARRYCGENPRVHFEPYDFYSGQPLPGDNYDVILAIEVFLHHPPEFLAGFLPTLAAAGRRVVNIDWSEDWPWPTPEHVWVHDFARLYADAGLTCATFPLPEKLEGKQQKLFVAGRELPGEITRLEGALKPGMTSQQAPAAEDWMQRLTLATDDLRRLIPRGSRFILVDDAHWGHVPALGEYRVVPFLEKNGAYWGPPADDEIAWQELQRLRAGGVSHIAFAWPSFWWLQHYAAFAQRLRAASPCVLQNERLVVFKLNS